MSTSNTQGNNPLVSSNFSQFNLMSDSDRKRLEEIKKEAQIPPQAAQDLAQTEASQFAQRAGIDEGLAEQVLIALAESNLDPAILQHISNAALFKGYIDSVGTVDLNMDTDINPEETI